MATPAEIDEGHSATVKWLVRNEKGETFGPVDFETLKSWARDGRLAPGNEVSDNSVQWQLATALRGLEMDWVAEVTPGTFYGPIHRAALDDLVKEGAIAGTAPYFLRRESLSGLDHSLPQSAPEVERLRELLADREKQAQRQAVHYEEQLTLQQQQAADYVKQIEHMRLRLSESDAQARAARQQIALHTDQERASQQHAQAKMAELGRQIEQAHQEQATLTARLNALRAESAQQAAGWLAKEQACSKTEQELRAALTRAQTEASERLARVGQLEAAAQELQAALARVQAEASERLARVGQLEQARHELQESQARAQAEAAARAERIAQLEAAVASAERSVRQLEACDGRARALAEELESLKAARAEDLRHASQLKARCDVLAEQLGSAQQGAGGDAQQAASRQDNLTRLRRRDDRLQVLLREASALLAEEPNVADGIETLEAEPVEEVDPKRGGTRAASPPVEAEVLPPEKPKPADKPRSAPPAGPSKPGISLADLEQQARRELERLGAHGSTFFKKKK